MDLELSKITTDRIVWHLPIKTISEANCSEHWSKKHRRHKLQKYFINLLLKPKISQVRLPCHIKLTRISTRMLDYDNLVSSQKWILDSICSLILPGLAPGRADSDKRISVSYNQEKGEKIGLQIEITNL